MKMWKGFFIFIVIFAILGATIFKYETTPPKTTGYSIGILTAGESRMTKLDGLKQGLIDLGFDKDESQFHVFNAYDQINLIERKAQKLIDEHPDVIVTMGAIETTVIKKKLQQTKQNIPVVFAGIAAPKNLGIVDDYKNPGGIFTGIGNDHANLSGKRLEMLTELVPDIQRVLVIYDGQLEVSRLSLDVVKKASKNLGVPIKSYDIESTSLFKQLGSQVQKGDGLLILPSHRIEASASEIVAFANQHGVPSMGIYDSDVKQGYLSAYGASFYNQGYQSARYVSLILQGTPPGDLPIQLPDVIHFTISEQTKNSMDVSLNPALLRIADVVPSPKKGVSQ